MGTELGGTPPPLNGKPLCSKKLSGKGGYPPLNGKNPLSSFWKIPLAFRNFCSCRTAPDHNETFTVTNMGSIFTMPLLPDHHTQDVTVSRSIESLSSSGNYTFYCGSGHPVTFCLQVRKTRMTRKSRFASFNQSRLCVSLCLLSYLPWTLRRSWPATWWQARCQL